MKILAIIPARGGSKGIPHKNIVLLGGKPLLVYSIEAALQTPAIQRVVVSTDDAAIAKVAQDHGAEVIWRPAELSGDEATSESALRHAVDYLRDTERYEPDLVVFLQGTSPIRKPQDIEHAIQTLVVNKADSLLSVTPNHHFLWQDRNGELQSINYDYRHRPRRQEFSPQYVENGSLYIFKPWVLRQFNNRLGGKIARYEMDDWSSYEIDTPEDLALCEWILQRKVFETTGKV